MLQPSFSVLLLSPFLVLTLLQIQATADNFLTATCSQSDTYAIGSTFESNLLGLLDSLYTTAITNGAFSALSSGNSTNKAYGLIMCYADSDVHSCFSCLKYATSQATQRCPGSASAINFYDQCFLKYSSKDFRSQVDSDDQLCLASTASPLDDASKKLVVILISYLTMVAPQSPEMTGKNETMISNGTISALVQCTRDLSQNGCTKCLQSAIVNDEFSTCFGKAAATGMRIIFGSCYIRYESRNLSITSFPITASPEPRPVAIPVARHAGGNSFGIL